MSEITPNTPNPVREDAYKQQLAAKLGIDPQYIPGSPIWHSEEEIAAIAEMFANMSGGSSGGGVLVVTDTDGTLNASYQDISDAGYAVFKRGPQYGESYFIPLYSIYHEDGEKYVVTFGSAGGTNLSYSADSPTDELVYDNSGD